MIRGPHAHHHHRYGKAPYITIRIALSRPYSAIAENSLFSRGSFPHSLSPLLCCDRWRDGSALALLCRLPEMSIVFTYLSSGHPITMEKMICCSVPVCRNEKPAEIREIMQGNPIFLDLIKSSVEKPACEARPGAARWWERGTCMQAGREAPARRGIVAYEGRRKDVQVSAMTMREEMGEKSLGWHGNGGKN